MKRLFAFTLAVLFYLTTFGCQTQNPDPSSGLPNLSDDEKETINTDDYIYGRIIDKTAPNILVLTPYTPAMINKWGETVYIITDEADEWLIDDEIEVTFYVAERPHDTSQYVRIIADEVHALALSAKPIIYFYPETPTLCSAELVLNGQLTCTYPSYADGWNNFIAHPGGTLIFPDGKEYYALYWEGIQASEWDFTRGYCIRGEDTAAFLEWALSKQGLTDREANEFIIYWLPLMQDNPYNVISFQNDAYTDEAALNITPTPDSLLRVFMAFYPSSHDIDIEPQAFDEFERNGFTVVEWGGCQVKKIK